MKQKLSTQQQIEHLESKGIVFELCSKEDAAAYLRKKNNFLRLSSYRFLFEKQIQGKAKGCYLNLDFAYLADLASIDRILREVFLLITLDIEHFAKIKLLGIIDSLSAENGYSIVSDFKDSLSPSYRKRLSNELHNRSDEGIGRDIYAGNLISKYELEMPIWVFLEVVSFGTFLSFYRFCAQRWNDDTLLQEHYILKSVKALRNACAHNSCIVNGFCPGANNEPLATNTLIANALNDAGIKNTKARKAKLKNPRIGQIASTLYAFDAIVDSAKARERGYANLERLKKRIQHHPEYYTGHNATMSFFDFLQKLIDIWGQAGAE